MKRPELDMRLSGNDLPSRPNNTGPQTTSQRTTVGHRGGRPPRATCSSARGLFTHLRRPAATPGVTPRLRPWCSSLLERSHERTLAHAMPKRGLIGWPRRQLPGPTEAFGYASYFLGGGLPPPKLFGFCGLHAVPGPGKPPFKADGSKRPSLTSCPKFCVRPGGPLCEPSG
jgi:hypothetical protein